MAASAAGGFGTGPAIGKGQAVFNRANLCRPAIYAPAKKSHIAQDCAQPPNGQPGGRMLAPSLCRSFVAAVLIAAAPVASAPAAETYQPDPALLQAATKEGEVVLYTTHIVDQIVRPLIRTFQTYAPGIQVKYV